MLIIMCLIGTHSILAQSVKKIENSAPRSNLIPVSGTPLLNDAATTKTLMSLGGNSYKIRLNKTVSEAVGTERMFFVSRIDSNNFEEINFRLMSKGTLTQVWCAIDELNNGHLTQDIADTILVYMENKSGRNSVNPNAGVIAIDQEYFGNPPDKDGDGLLDVLVTDIKDSYDPQEGGGYIAGFFYSADQFNDADVRPAYRSNERDIIYIDSYPGIFSNGQRHVKGGVTTTAHEYQHLIHYNYDQNEYTFINEGLSENAEYVTGLGTRESNSYLSNVNIPIFRWRREDALPDYSRASLFFNYVGDRIGVQNYKYFTQSPLHGAEGFAAALSAAGFGDLTFGEILHDFNIANILNDRNVDARYGYLNPARANLWIPEHPGHKVIATASDQGSFFLQQGGVGYVTFDHIDAQEATFTFPENVKVSAVVNTKSGTSSVYAISSGQPFELTYSGDDYPSIHYVATNTTPSDNGVIGSPYSEVTWVINGSKSYQQNILSTYGSSKYYWAIPYYNSSNVGRFGFSNKYTMPEDGDIAEFRLYLVYGLNTENDTIDVLGEGQLRLAAYSDNAGQPGTVLAQDTVDFSELGHLWNTFDVSHWGLQFKAGEAFHAVYEVIVPVVNSGINSIPLRLDDGRGSQGVTKIVSGPGEFTDMFTDDDTKGQHGVWNEISYRTYRPEAPVNLQAVAGDGEVMVRWSASLSPKFQKYRLYNGTTANPTSYLEITDANTDSMLFTGLANGKTYYFDLTMVDVTGVESARAGEVSALPLSNALAEYELGVLQNPVYTENLDIFLASNTPLDPRSITSNISVNDQKSPLLLYNVNNNNKVFQNTDYKLTQNGTIKVYAQAKLPGARFLAYDTLAFTVQYLTRQTSGQIASADNQLTINLDKNLLSENYWLTIIPAEQRSSEQQPAVPGNSFEPTKRTFSIGPLDKPLAGTLTWTIDDDNPRILFIARESNGEIEIMPTRYNSGENTLSTEVTTTGKYLLVKSTDGTENFSGAIPTEFALRQNYPNPFNPVTNIRFSLPETAQVKVEIFDMLGKKIVTLADGKFNAGYHKLTWSGVNSSGRRVASGFYFYQIKANQYQAVKKMLLLQ